MSNNIDAQLELYIKNIEKDYQTLEYILQNKLLLNDNNFYINYKLKQFQNIFKSLESNKTELFKTITKILNGNQNSTKIKKNSINYKNINNLINLFNKYPNIIDSNFDIKFNKTNIINQYIGITTFEEFAKKLYSIYSVKNNDLSNETLVNNDYSIWKLSAIQKILRNFISPNTPYYSVLIIHGTGVGKTCTAITIAENFKEYVKENNTKIQVIRPDEFKKQVFEINKLQQGIPDMQCTGETYIESLSDQTTFIDAVKDCEIGKRKDIREKACKKVEKTINKKINEYYNFKTKTIWAKNIMKLLKLKTKGLNGIKRQRKIIEVIRQELNNSIIIIDEAHNLRNLDTDIESKNLDNNLNNNNNDLDNINESINLIEILELVLLVGQNIRIVLLSATPMYDRASDIIPLLNLMLLNDYRPKITEKELFKDEYGNLNGEKSIKLINKISRGYISYVRGNDPINFPLRLTADKVLNKNELFDVSKYPKYDITGKKKIPSTEMVKYFKLINCQLSDTHANAIINKNTYIKKNKEDNKLDDKLNKKQDKQILIDEDYKYSVAYSTELQLGNFMYKTPKEADGNYQETYGINGFKSYFSKDKTGSYIPKNEDILSRFTLKELNKFGPKIAKILKSLEKSKGPIAIYSNYIYGGLIPVVIALEMAGYTRYNNVKEFIKSKKKIKETKGKYVLFTGDKQMSKGGDKYVELRSNMIKEEDVKVFLFSSAGSEGLSLFGYREMHILEPWHNVNLMEQSIGRIIRNRSHHHLEPKKRNATIYMYAAIFDNEFKDRESIDLRIYSICEMKALAIGKVESILKSNAFDCLVSRPTNIRDKQYFGKLVELENSHGKIIKISLEDDSYSRDTSYQKDSSYKCNVSNLDDKKNDILNTNDYTLSNNELYNKYFIEIRELKQLIIKILKQQHHLGYKDIKNLININLSIRKENKKNSISRIINLVLDELKQISKNKIIINSDNKPCKILILNNININNLKSFSSSRNIIRLLPLDKYDPNLDILQEKYINKSQFKIIDYTKLDTDINKYYKGKDIDLTELIEIKKNKFKKLQNKEELNITTLFNQITDKIDYFKGIIKTDKQMTKFNFNTNFNLDNKLNVGNIQLITSIYERLLVNEKYFVLMYLIVKLITETYKNMTTLEKQLLQINYNNIVFENEINFLSKLNGKFTDPQTYDEKEEILNKLDLNTVKGFIIANENNIKYYEFNNINKNVNNGKILSFTYLKTLFKDNKINLEKVLMSKFKKMNQKIISKLYGYLVYEKKYQQPKFKITDYISRGFKKSVKGIFCANKHIGEINKLINMLIPITYINEHKLIKNLKKNKKLLCGDLEIFFRIRNYYINTEFNSRLDKGNIYFLNPEEYYIWQKYDENKA
jgi:hypothetical protein